MTKFSYIAIDANKKTVNGSTDLTDRAAVINALKKQGLRPISVRESSATRRPARHTATTAPSADRGSIPSRSGVITRCLGERLDQRMHPVRIRRQFRLEQ